MVTWFQTWHWGLVIFWGGTAVVILLSVWVYRDLKREREQQLKAGVDQPRMGVDIHHDEEG